MKSPRSGELAIHFANNPVACTPQSARCRYSVRWSYLRERGDNVRGLHSLDGVNQFQVPLSERDGSINPSRNQRAARLNEGIVDDERVVVEGKKQCAYERPHFRMEIGVSVCVDRPHDGCWPTPQLAGRTI